MTTEKEFERLLTALNEKEVLLKEQELALAEQQEEFLAQKEELNAAIDEVVQKNNYLQTALDELKLRNDELDQILYRASHDLRTPVSSLFGLIDILQSTPVTAEQKVIVNHLLDKTTQMDLLLDSLTDLSVAFYKQLEPVHCSIAEIVSDIWNGLKAPNSCILECQMRNISIVTDRTLFSILLSSLLKNAVQFSVENMNNKISINGFVSGSLVTIEIADDGEEISSEISEKIFQMFFRGSLKSKGQGLGLYIAQRIARRLGGSIQLVNSKPKKKFVITLPATMTSSHIAVPVP